MNNRTIFCEYRDGRYDYLYIQKEVKNMDPKLGSYELLIKVESCYIARHQPDVLMKLFTKRAQLSFSPASCVSGIVVDAGTMVTRFKQNDKVIGCVPLDSQYTGCADYCILNDIYVVHLPSTLDYHEGVVLMNAGIKAYSALHYLARLKPNDKVIVYNASSMFGCLLVQLAKIWEAKVVAIVLKTDDKLHLQKLTHPPDNIIEVDPSTVNSTNLVASMMEATGHLGADVIVDDGVRLFVTEEESLAAKEDLSSWKPTKQEVISCLSVGGRWVTCNPLLQVDPLDSMQLFLRQCTIGYLFDQAWVLSSSKQGKWNHIMKDLLTKVQEGQIQPPHIPHLLPFNDVIKLHSNHDDVVVSMTT